MKKLNKDFIRIIKETLPQKVNIACLIMECLDIGKEAAYRRLRDEVPFSFLEVSIIARKLGISLDQMIGNYESKSAVFNLNLLHSDQAMNNYKETLIRYHNYLQLMANDPEASLNVVANTLPYVLYLPYINIAKFRLSRWLHLTDSLKPTGSLDSIVIPQEIQKIQSEVYEAIQNIPNTYMMWDINLFHSLIKEIDYFHKLNYINEENVENLKKEFHLLIDFTEKIASSGCYPNGRKVYIYLSNIHFESSYTYLEKKDFSLSMIRLYSVNSIDTLHPEVCRLQKEWIQTLKRYSTSITESGQIQRISFFNEQRKLLEELL